MLVGRSRGCILVRIEVLGGRGSAVGGSGVRVDGCGRRVPELVG